MISMFVGGGVSIRPSRAIECGVERFFSLAGELAWEPHSTHYGIDIGLDRQSFLDRGFTEEQLGRWNNGSTSERRGVFLSMFYGLQNLNPNDPAHAWNEDVHPWDRGLGAHIDYWRRDRHNKPYFLYAYDNPNPPTRRGVIVARNADESPFDVKPEAVVGTYFEGGDEIYIKADAPDGWCLGHRMDEDFWIKCTDENYRMNLTYIIAHEVGHFFGFPHVDDGQSIMNANVGGTSERQRWQTPQTDALFITLASKIQGP